MEFSEVQIARLILGYLKSNHYTSTFNKFLEECHHFEKMKQPIRSGEHYPTRVGGMSLVEFLEEYANIYTIVQARLEDTDYFNGDKRRSSLGIIDQLMYLLNTRTAHVSTPASSVCSSEVEATSCDALPGNLHDTDTTNQLLHKLITPKRKFLKTHSSSRCSLNETIDPADVSDVITQHLLDKTEFHVKLANTINVIRNSPEIINRQEQQQQSNCEQQQQQQQQQNVEEIGVSASKELETLIKSVVEKTEEDPIYNQLLDEIMGVPLADSTSSHKKSSMSDSNTDEQYVIRRKYRPISSSCCSETIEIQNDDAIRGIIAAASSSSSSQSQEQPTTVLTVEATTTTTTTPVITVTTATATTTASTTTTTTNGGIYIYDGNTTTTTTMLNQNQFLFGTSSILVVPQLSQCDMINNNTEQQQQQQNCPRMFNENEIMAMPTIFINEDEMPPVASNITIVTTANEQVKKLKRIKPKIDNVANNVTNKKKPIEIVFNNSFKSIENRVANSSPLPPPRHVRNLDFSTPSKLLEITSTTPPPIVTTTTTSVNTDTKPTTTTITKTITTTATQKKNSAWDTDLRMMIYGESGTKIEEPRGPRKRKPRTKKNTKNPTTTTTTTTKEKDKNSSKEKNDDVDEKKSNKEENEKINDVTKSDKNDYSNQEEKKSNDNNKEENSSPIDEQLKNQSIVLDTPTKDCQPKTPGGAGGGVGNLTPFTQVIEEQLQGIDILSFPTPKVPVTPGFGLQTPIENNYQQRGTDYSTSSSYYIPSDNEQNNKSIEKKAAIIEEEEAEKVNIISDVVIIDKTTTKCGETLQKFNSAVVAKKDLKLMELSDISSASSLSSSDSEDDDDDKKDDRSQFKVHKETINEIIKKVDVQTTLPSQEKEQSKKKQILNDLEEKRRRTIERMQQHVEKKPSRCCNNNNNNTRNKSKITQQSRRLSKKSDSKIDDKKIDNTIKNGSVEEEDEAKKLVQGLWERGICLVPNKPQIKPPPPPQQQSSVESLEPPNDEEFVFDRYNCSEMLEISHQDGFIAKKLNQYDLKCLEKKFEATFSNDYNNDGDRDASLTRKFVCLPFVQLLDIPAVVKRTRRNTNVGGKSTTTPTPTKGQLLTTDNDKLMDLGKVSEISPEFKPKMIKKRKLKTVETEKCTEKKSRKHENNIKLLRDINVDDFLDKVHNS